MLQQVKSNPTTCMLLSVATFFGGLSLANHRGVSKIADTQISRVEEAHSDTLNFLNTETEAVILEFLAHTDKFEVTSIESLRQVRGQAQDVAAQNQLAQLSLTESEKGLESAFTTTQALSKSLHALSESIGKLKEEFEGYSGQETALSERLVKLAVSVQKLETDISTRASKLKKLLEQKAKNETLIAQLDRQAEKALKAFNRRRSQTVSYGGSYPRH